MIYCDFTAIAVETMEIVDVLGKPRLKFSLNRRNGNNAWVRGYLKISCGKPRVGSTPTRPTCFVGLFRSDVEMLRMVGPFSCDFTAIEWS